jgi:hypothetical protein
LEGRGTKFVQITDGLSNTIFVGEKHVPLDAFGVGWFDSSVYNGDYPTSYARSAVSGEGLATSPRDPNWKFGSYHMAVCQFVMGDGRVVGLYHTIDPAVLALLATINDGQPLPDY